MSGRMLHFRDGNLITNRKTARRGYGEPKVFERAA